MMQGGGGSLVTDLCLNSLAARKGPPPRAEVQQLAVLDHPSDGWLRDVHTVTDLSTTTIIDASDQEPQAAIS